MPNKRYPSTTTELLAFGNKFFEGCVGLVAEKNKRYAGNHDPFRNLKIAGDYGIAVRMSDKVTRLLTLLHPANTVDAADESIEDTLRDLANYAMLCAGLRRNERGEPNGDQS